MSFIEDNDIENQFAEDNGIIEFNKRKYGNIFDNDLDYLEEKACENKVLENELILELILKENN